MNTGAGIVRGVRTADDVLAFAMEPAALAAAAPVTAGHPRWGTAVAVLAAVTLGLSFL